MTTLSLDTLESRSLPSTGLLSNLSELRSLLAEAQSFTPPIGSNKGSFQINRFMGDGWGLDFLVAPNATAASSSAAAQQSHRIFQLPYIEQENLARFSRAVLASDAAMAEYLQHGPNHQGIIAILIGLFAPPR